MERRPDGRLRDEPRGGPRRRWGARDPRRWSLPLEKECCRWNYCRARVLRDATAKGMPRGSTIFSGMFSQPAAGPAARRYRTRTIVLKPSGPGPDRRVAAAVGMKDGKRIGGARLGSDRHEHAAPPG